MARAYDLEKLLSDIPDTHTGRHIRSMFEEQWENPPVCQISTKLWIRQSDVPGVPYVRSSESIKVSRFHERTSKDDIWDDMEKTMPYVLEAFDILGPQSEDEAEELVRWAMNLTGACKDAHPAIQAAHVLVPPEKHSPGMDPEETTYMEHAIDALRKMTDAFLNRRFEVDFMPDGFDDHSGYLAVRFPSGAVYPDLLWDNGENLYNEHEIAAAINELGTSPSNMQDPADAQDKYALMLSAVDTIIPNIEETIYMAIRLYGADMEDPYKDID